MHRYIIPNLILLFLTSCSTNPNNSLSLYLDSDKVEIDSSEISISSCSCSQSRDSSYSLSLDLLVKNLSYSTRKYQISDVTLLKESTNAKYTVSTRPYLYLEAEMKNTMSFYSSLPSDIKEDNYSLAFKLDNIKVNIGLYDSPDSLREDRKVNYYIDDKLVQTQIVKDKRKLSNLYTYEESSHSNHCSAWRLGSPTGTLVSKDTTVTEDMNLYGYTTSNFNWMTTSTDAFNFLQGINYIPSDRILVVPAKQNDKEICISMYGIQYCNFNKVYLPNTIHKIYSGNFNNRESSTIYYEGTSEEWAKLFFNKSDAFTDRVIFNTKSPY